MRALSSTAARANRDEQHRQVQCALRPRIMGEYLREVLTRTVPTTSRKEAQPAAFWT